MAMSETEIKKVRHVIFNADVLTKAFGAIFITGTLAIASWTMREAYTLRMDYEAFKANSAANAVADKVSATLYRDEINRRFAEQEKRLDRTDARNDQQYSEIQRMLEKLNDKLDRLQSKEGMKP